MMSGSSFYEWIKHATITDDPVGDFIIDCREQIRMNLSAGEPGPGYLLKVRSLKGLQYKMHRTYPGMNYRDSHACLPEVWDRYEKWRRF